MQKFIPVILFLLVSLETVAQNESCEQHIKKLPTMLFLHMRPVEDIDCDYTGATLVLIKRENDSLVLKTLYASCHGYSFENDDYLVKNLNKYYKDSVSEHCNIILPIYFDYYDRKDTIKVSPIIKDAIKMEISKLNNKQFIILNPLEITFGKGIIDKVPESGIILQK